MRVGVRTASAALSMLWASAAWAPAAGAADCRSLGQSFQQAVQAGNLEEVARQQAAVFAEPGCPDAFRKQVGGVAASVFGQAVMQRVAAGEALTAQEPLLRQALSMGRPWFVLALTGDLHAERKEHEAAAALYQEALTVINDKEKTPKPPSTEEIQRIFRRASEAGLLAANYVPAPTNRAGEPDGLASADIRGFGVQTVPVPITFETNTAVFTEKGQRAAADMAEWLRAQRPAGITIVGHTDERGSDVHNDALSRERAQAVASFLRQAGYQGRVTVEGRGEREPFVPDNPGRYSQDERWQLDRRVELKRSGPG